MFSNNNNVIVMFSFLFLQNSIYCILSLFLNYFLVWEMF